MQSLASAIAAPFWGPWLRGSIAAIKGGLVGWRKCQYTDLTIAWWGRCHTRDIGTSVLVIWWAS